MRRSLHPIFCIDNINGIEMPSKIDVTCKIRSLPDAKDIRMRNCSGEIERESLPVGKKPQKEKKRKSNGGEDNRVIIGLQLIEEMAFITLLGRVILILNAYLILPAILYTITDPVRLMSIFTAVSFPAN